MKTAVYAFLVSAVALLGAACVPRTEFRGSPTIPAGAQGCQSMCQAQGLTMAGMVFMGEYSDGCVCMVPGQPGAASVAVGGAAQAAAGVRMQMTQEEEEDQQRRLNSRSTR